MGRKRINKSDSEIAKNYLNDQELDALNKIVTAYLDIAEVQALNALRENTDGAQDKILLDLVHIIEKYRGAMA